jgi:hypothetical protein
LAKAQQPNCSAIPSEKPDHSLIFGQPHLWCGCLQIIFHHSIWRPEPEAIVLGSHLAWSLRFVKLCSLVAGICPSPGLSPGLVCERKNFRCHIRCFIGY